MDRKEWFIDSHNKNIKDNYHFIEKIASGGFGIVYLAEHRKTGKLIQNIIKGPFKFWFLS